MFFLGGHKRTKDGGTTEENPYEKAERANQSLDRRIDPADFLIRDNQVHRHIRRRTRNAVNDLKIVTDTRATTSNIGQQPVIIPFSKPETIAVTVESDPGNQDLLNELKGVLTEFQYG